jgi:hypothetical protein
MKTGIHWLQDYLSRDEFDSVKNLLHNKYRLYSNAADALDYCLTWAETSQGHSYWSDIKNEMRSGSRSPLQDSTRYVCRREVVQNEYGKWMLKDNAHAIVGCYRYYHHKDVCRYIDIGEFEGHYAHENNVITSDYSDKTMSADEAKYTTDNRCFHEDEASDYNIVWAENIDEWADEDDCLWGVYNSRGREAWLYNDGDLVYCDENSTYYSSEAVANANDIYYHDGQYRHSDNIHDEDDDDYCVRDYHHFSRVSKYGRETPNFTVGFEIEKEDRGAKCGNDAQDIYDATKWCHEKDSSLDSYSGFELVSPILDLYDTDTLLKEFNHPMIKPLINASWSSESCGGHINVGSSKYNSEQLANGIVGFFPLLYAMYPNRLDKSYSQAKSKHRYFENKDKYSSVLIKPNVVELRIFPAVRGVDNLMWRVGLVRLMVENLYKSELDVLKMMLNTRSRLYKHLSKVYTPEKMIDKVSMFIKYSNIYNGTMLEFPTKKENKTKTNN